MKRNLLLFGAALVLSFSATAQIYSEDFEGTGLASNDDFALTGWTNTAEIGTRVWQYKEFTDNMGTPDDATDDVTYKYAQASSFGSGEANVYSIVTPSIDLTGATGTALSFEVKAGYYTHDGLTIWISDDAGANWTDITSNFTLPVEPTSGYGEFASSGSMDLGAHTGAIMIKFTYTGDENNSETGTFQINSVLVEGSTGVNDLEVSNFSMSPNPVTNVLNIKGNVSNVVITNAIGQKLISTDQNRIETSSLRSGLYFVTVVAQDGTISTRKLIKR